MEENFLGTDNEFGSVAGFFLQVLDLKDMH